MYRKIIDEHLAKLVTAGALFILISIVSVANIEAQTTTRPDRGFGGGGGFQTTEIDSISMQNGGLNLHIPLASLPPIAGGKLSYTLAATYNSKLWDIGRGEVHIVGLDCGDNYTTQYVGPADGGAGWRIGGGYEIFFRRANDDYGYQPPISEQCDGADYYFMNLGIYFKPMLRTPDGSEHELRIDGNIQTYGNSLTNREYLLNYYLWPGGLPNQPAFSSPVRFYTVDETFLTVIYNPISNPLRWTLYTKDGTRVEQSTDGQRTIDKNGNSILMGQRTVGGNPEGFVQDEQTGREIKLSATTYSGQPATKVEYQSVGGTWQTVTVVWGTTTVKGKVHTYTAWDTLAEAPCSNIYQMPETPFSVIREIIFPATEQGVNPRKFTFAYNSDATVQATTPGENYCGQPVPTYTRSASVGWGEVSDVTTPTGAQIKYTYGNDGTHDFVGIGSPDILDAIAGNGVGSKTVTHDGTTDTWLYGGGSVIPSMSSGGGATSPDGSTYSEVYYPTNPAYGLCCGAGTDGMRGRLVKTIESGRILTERHWTPLGGLIEAIGSRDTVAVNAVVDTEYITLLAEDGVTRLKMSAKKYSYDYNGELTQTIEYDWFDPSTVTFTNPGSPMYSHLRIPAAVPSGATVLRVTNNSYYNQAANGTSTNAYHKRSVGSSTVILGKPQEATVGDGTTVKGTTRFSFDGQSYGSAPTLGNLTKVSAWDDSVAGGQWLDALTTYTPRGNVQSATDAKGNITQITYGSINGYTDLYPTQTVAAYGTPIARTLSAVYDFHTGLVTTATDVDNNLSAATEYDILGRPTKVKNAVGTALESWTTTEYSDSNRRIIVRSDLETVGDGKKVAIQHFDQLGRVRLSRSIENIATEDPYNEQQGIKAETRFGYNDPTPTVTNDPQNTLGAYVLSSNPFRAATATAAANEQSMGWTLSYAVKTGRHCETTTFSGAGLPVAFGGSNTNSTGVVQTDADADRTLVTDQAGKQRISRTNALGQLKDIWEVKGSDADTEAITFGTLSLNGLKTSYSYDTLNNLTTVNQGAQTRTFTYSSLSRLLSAANPESGTINYVYDANGNLTSKVDARSITTAYTYDALNRVTQRSYNDSPQTPTVTYTYGSAAPAIGKLTKVSSSVSTTEYTSFDILGRVTGHKQTTDGTDYTTGYVYNLSGALIEETYPSTRKVKNVIDNNGDLALVQSKKNSNYGFFTYANSFTYNAAGALTSMQLGNGRWESTGFNSRLQPTQIALGTTPNATDKLKLEYGYGTTANNGNVASQKITVVRSGQSDLVFDQTYTYDSLNRITSAEEKTGTTTNWKQVYTFDRYGNRNFDEANTTTLPKNCGTSPNFVVCTADVPKINPAVNTSNNRLTGYTFDAAGNVITDADGRTFSYDGENKQKEAKNSSAATLGTYYFDGDGKRVKKVVPSTGEVTIFVYDAGGKLVAEYSTNVVPQNDAKVQYLTNDNLGTPRINTDQLGNVVSRSDYMPYGEEIIALGGRSSTDKYVSDDVRQGFTGYQNDDETGLDFAEARMYSNTRGRFSGADPLFIEAERLLDPQRINLYSYTRNSPLKFVDQDGLDVQIIDKTKDKTGDDEYLRLANARDGKQFQVALDKKNKLSIVDSQGKALGAGDLKTLGNGLTGSEKELFTAITDKDNHAKVSIVRNDPNILTFGAYKGDGKNTIDVGDLAVLSASKPTKTNASNIAMHETLEAFTSARLKTGFGPAHNYVNQFFPGLGTASSGGTDYSPDGSNVTGGTLIFPIVNGGGSNLEVTVKFKTPIPVKSLPKAKQKFRPFNITKTKETP